jgi:hypothetical protein
VVEVAKGLLLDPKVEKMLEVLLTIFAIYLLIQILRQILGGSWTSEDIVLGILIFNTGSIFTVGLMLAQLRSDHEHLGNQFKSLADDFKAHTKAHMKGN